MGNCCRSCMVRTPYASLIATLICLAGVGVFCTTYFRGIALTISMFDQVFRFRTDWLPRVQTGIVIVAAVLAAVGLLILFVGILTTGETRSSVYRAWQSRVGGRISCAVFIVITYLYEIIWIGIFGALFMVTALVKVFSSLCTDRKQPYGEHNCIDFTQFHFLFPYNTRPEDMKICEVIEMKLFCKDFVERAVVMFFIATIASAVIILSLAHYLMSLSANYAHIKDHKKLKDYQDIYYYNVEPELTALAGKDRDRYDDEGETLP